MRKMRKIGREEDKRMNGEWVRGRESGKRVKEERVGKRKGMKGDKGEGKWGIGRKENGEERGEGKDEEYRIRIVENGERERRGRGKRRRGGKERNGWSHQETVAYQNHHRQTADTYLSLVPRLLRGKGEKSLVQTIRTCV